MDTEKLFGFETRMGQASTMSARGYVAAITFFIAGGLGAAAWLASITYGMKPEGWWILAYFAVAIPGVIISMKSDNWFFSLIGYGMVVAATGSICGPFVALYELDSVMQVAMITISVSAGVGIAGMIYPESVEGWGGIFIALLLLIIIGDVSRAVMQAYGYQVVTLQWIDYAAAGIFIALIFYDMNRAMRLPRTLDNAVDSACALYLDIINLFIRLLKIYGKAKR